MSKNNKRKACSQNVQTNGGDFKVVDKDQSMEDATGAIISKENSRKKEHISNNNNHKRNDDEVSQDFNIFDYMNSEISKEEENEESIHQKIPTNNTLEEMLKLDTSISCHFVRNNTKKIKIQDIIKQKEQERIFQKLISISESTLYTITKDNQEYYIQRNENKINRLEYIRNHFLNERQPQSKMNSHEILLNDYIRTMDDIKKSKIKKNDIINDEDVSNMTLLERVRARDKKAEKGKTSGNDVSIDLLRLADTVRSYSRCRKRTTLPNETNISIPLTQIYPFLSGISTPKLSKRDVRNALQELSSKIPYWITLCHASDQPKKMVLRIKKCVDFGKIRVALGARQVNRPVSDVTSAKKRQVIPPSSHATTPSNEQVSQKALTTSKRTVTKIPIPSFRHDVSSFQEPEDKTPTKKRKAVDTTVTTPTLRINNHLLHPNDDGTIHFWEDSSPRGLKKMFTQLNSGSRI